MHIRTALGSWGEELVSQHLKEKGYTIVALNYRCRYGEIDIIASKQDLITCVEVKTRSKEYFATSVVITTSKQKKIIKTAKLFLQKQNISDVSCRFDVATVTRKNSAISYIENAFYG